MLSQGMGQFMVQKQRLEQVQAMRCGICATNDWNNHEPGCPIGEAEAVANMNLHRQCPKCGEWSIGRNAQDFLECRKCHAQFTTGGVFEREGDDKERYHYIEMGEDFVKVYELDDAGSGDFPIDKRLRALEEKIQAALGEIKKAKRQARGPRAKRMTGADRCKYLK